VWGRRVVHRILVEKFQESRQLGKHRRRWENIIKMILKRNQFGGI
jgi:hypothetical protein